MNTAKKLSIRLEAVGGDKVRQEFSALGNDGTKAFQRITQVITPANDNLKALDATARGFNNVLKQAAGLAGAYLGLRGITSIFRSIVATNTQFEQLSGSLKTVTGSVSEAKKAFSLIEEFATTTPFQLEEIVDAFIRLKAMGLDPSMDALTSYGNTASAFGKNILDFVGAVAAATVGEFERLKTFGVKAKVEADKVQFVFQGVSTTVSKNATEIEQYLRNLGKVQFSGAMAEQMKTLGGISSNISDNFSKLARDIGANGLNDAIREVLSRFNELIGGSGNVAKTIGGVLATAVQIAGKAFFFLADNAELVATLLLARFGSPAILGGIALLKGGLNTLSTSMIGLGLASKNAMLGITMMSQVSKLAAAGMYATALAAGVLKGALALIGGPVGLAILAGAAIYKLVDSHDVAKRAANDHADTLKRLQDELKNTTEQAASFTNQQSKNQALADWGYKLKTAEQNVKDLSEELKATGGLGFFDRNTPNHFLKEYEIFAKETAQILKQSKIDLAEYQRMIWEIAAEYPDFQPQAEKIQDKILLLKAAEQDYWTAKQELKYINNPDLRPKVKAEQNIVITPKVDAKEYEKNLEDIKKRVLELQDPYDQAMQKAAEWRDNALKNLDDTKAGYETFKNDINRVYDDMVKKAGESALKSSKNWQDGITRGMQGVYADMSDTAKMTEGLIKNSFKNMEDTLVNFVMTGKMNFADFANSVVSEMVRMAMQYAVIKPLMGGLMGYFGIPMAHSGGVIGSDMLSSKPINPSVFAGATKYHTGGLVGDEIPIIAQRGETVFTKGQMAALGDNLNSKTPVMVNVNIFNKADGTKATAQSSQDANGNVSLGIIIEQIESTIGRNIGRGEGLAPLLEQRYALNPAFGSYR